MIKKGLIFWVILIFVGAIIVHSSCSQDNTDSGLSDYVGSRERKHVDADTITATEKFKMKEWRHQTRVMREKTSMDGLNMEDYPRFDPSPSSKAVIRAGPIEHGIPIMPYIPKPTPPSHPRHGNP